MQKLETGLQVFKERSCAVEDKENENREKVLNTVIISDKGIFKPFLFCVVIAIAKN